MIHRYAALPALFTLCLFASAKAEVTDCTVIAALPAIIDAPGIWCLKSNLTWNKKSGRAIDIRTSFVTLDLNGFLLNGLGAGTDTLATGIHSPNRRDVTIRNGIVRGFYRGVHIEGTGSVGNLLENLRLDQNRGVAVDLQGSGNILRNSHVLNTGGTPGEFDNNVAVGVTQAHSTTITDNVISGTGANFGAYGISIDGSDLTEIRGNSVLNTAGGQTGYAILSNNSTNTTIQNNRVLNGTGLGNFGIVGSGGSGINCIDNVVARFSTTITGCTFSSGNLTPP